MARGRPGEKPFLTKLSSLAALEVVKMTTSSAASDENLVMSYPFQCGSGQQWELVDGKWTSFKIYRILPTDSSNLPLKFGLDIQS